MLFLARFCWRNRGQSLLDDTRRVWVSLGGKVVQAGRDASDRALELCQGWRRRAWREDATRAARKFCPLTSVKFLKQAGNGRGESCGDLRQCGARRVRCVHCYQK
jgi:hypothetical protein